jgi:hypothetical protein
MGESQVVMFKKLTGQGIIKVAARHNLREFELMAPGFEHIHASQSHLNHVLRGPAGADAVAALAAQHMRQAEVGKLRSDAVRGVEIIVSLPGQSPVNGAEYFAASVSWAENHFAVPVLSAVAHYDEATPHCHIILLPLRNGRMQGSDLVGGKAKLRATKADFFEKVGKQFGLRFEATVFDSNNTEKRKITAQILARLKEISGLSDAVLDALVRPHLHNPARLAKALGIIGPKNTTRTPSFVSIMTKPCKESRSSHRVNTNPIGFAAAHGHMRHETLSCVGFAAPVPASVQPAAQDSPARRDEQRDSNRPNHALIAEDMRNRDELEQVKARTTVTIREGELPSSSFDDVTGEFVPAQPCGGQGKAKQAAMRAVRDALEDLDSARATSAKKNTPSNRQQ